MGTAAIQLPVQQYHVRRYYKTQHGAEARARVSGRLLGTRLASAQFARDCLLQSGSRVGTTRDEDGRWNEARPLVERHLPS